jgi:Concanavalin A-like lectin/glucanases superfamily
MTHWVLLVAPLVLASFVLLFVFVGCGLSTHGLEGPEQYATDVTGNLNSISYWRLGEAAGAITAADSKGSNDGTYTGGVTLGEAGLVLNDPDTAAKFDGSTGYVAVPRNDDSLNPPAFTVEALVSVAGGEGQFRAVVSSRDVDAGAGTFGYILYANDQNKWQAWVGDGTTAWQMVTGPDVTPGDHYLAMTYDKTTLKLYVDPVEDSPASMAVPYQPNAARELRIGAGANEADPPLYFFNGVIDDVAVYDAPLDFATIKAHSDLARLGITEGETG